jgi:hypothetical protein
MKGQPMHNQVSVYISASALPIGKILRARPAGKFTGTNFRILNLQVFYSSIGTVNNRVRISRPLPGVKYKCCRPEIQTQKMISGFILWLYTG